MFYRFIKSIRCSWLARLLLPIILICLLVYGGVYPAKAMQSMRVLGGFRYASGQTQGLSLFEPTSIPFASKYIPQPGTPIYSSNLFHPNQGCNWAGVGGQVFDAASQPVQKLVVELNGVVSGKIVYALELTGSASAYGPGGFEFEFAGGPVKTQRAFWLVIYDLQGNHLSEPVYFDTYSDCGRNLVMINFVASSSQPTTSPTPTQTAVMPTSPTPVPTSQALTPSPSPTSAVIKYVPQSGLPIYTNNIFHSEKGCKWLGIGGQVLGANAVPVQKLVVELGGKLSGKDVYKLVLTGSATVIGPGGFEFQIASNPIKSEEALWLLFYDMAGRRLSERAYFNTYEDCSRNQVIFNFIEAGSQPTATTPVMPNPTKPVTPTPSRTPTPLPPTARYILQPGSPAYLTNIFHPDMSCRWMGVAGQVFGADAQPVKQLVVELGGSLNGKNMSVLGLTGNNPAYGPGGFELEITGRPTASQSSLWLVLYDLGGNRLSEPTYFNTYGDCERNLILVNFVQRR